MSKRVTKKSPKKSKSEKLQGDTTLRPGSILGGRWKLTKKLGEGGMGEVWEGQHVTLGSVAAIKISKEDSKFAKEGFEREGYVNSTVAELTHVPTETPGTVEVFDTGTSPKGFPFIVMEKLQGKSGRDYMMQFPGAKVPPRQVAEALDEVLAVLEPMHAAGFVHRDLKPDNLYFTNNGALKVIDFGLAKTFPTDDAPGSFLGTPGYAPPEQGIGLADVRSDIYSLGTTALAMLSGGQAMADLPTRDTSQGEAYLTRHGIDPGLHVAGEFTFKDYPGCPVKPAKELVPGIPEKLGKVLDKALACEPNKRYKSAHAMRKDLNEAIFMTQFGKR